MIEGMRPIEEADGEPAARGVGGGWRKSVGGRNVGSHWVAPDCRSNIYRALAPRPIPDLQGSPALHSVVPHVRRHGHVCSISLNDGDVPRLSATHCRQRNRAIERRKSSSVGHRQRKQVDIGELVGTQNSFVVKKLLVQDGGAIGPENVVGLHQLLPQQSDRESGRNRIGVARVRNDPHESVLRQWA